MKLLKKTIIYKQNPYEGCLFTVCDIQSGDQQLPRSAYDTTRCVEIITV